jgi:serine/threonine-protein kinase RsbW
MWLADSTTGVYRWAGVVPESLTPHALDIPADDALPQSASLRAGEVVLLDATAATTIPEVLTSLGTPSGTLVLTPLAALDRTLGVLALGFDVDRQLEPDELELFKTLGRQAGQAVERAALFDEQRSVAETLQRSLLPRDVPDDPRLMVAAVYRPAVDGLEVGGDWFDAFHLDRDRVGLVVGDVVGRGLHAAAAMGQLRSAVRALATTDAGPALLLNRLDRFVAGVEAADTATMVYAELDLRDGRLRYACAGHPPPVLVGAGGISDLLWGGRSAPLGAHFSTAPRGEAETIIGPGSRLVLYTDGLVERRDAPLDERIEKLAATLQRLASTPFAALVDDVTDAMVGTDPTGDDVCLLAVELHAGVR